MISVKVVQLNGNRLAKVRQELRYLSTDDFFRTIPLVDFSDLVEAKLRALSPSGRSKYRAYLESLGHPKESLSFSQSWRVKRGNRGARIEFTIWNLLETIGGRSGDAKFKAIEFGSNASEWIVRRTFKIKIKRDWITMVEGRSMTHAGNDAANVQARTRDYIEQVLLPRIGLRINNLIENRLNK